MVGLSTADIENAIYPVGFYRRKSVQIREISKTLIEENDSKVPDEIDDLLKLKGVGRKTANIVVTFGFGKPGIAVDTHVHRISNRLGLVLTKTPDQTEFELRRIRRSARGAASARSADIAGRLVLRGRGE
jgi:endonuclease-3